MLQDASLPSYDELFGDLTFRHGDESRSVYSPAAYLADLLQLLGNRTGAAPPALVARRPDIPGVPLDAEHTYTELPYLDIVNEILERAVEQANTTADGADAIGLIDLIEYTGSGTVPRELAMRPVTTHGLVLDGEDIKQLTVEDLTQMSKQTSMYDGDCSVNVQYLIDDGGFDYTMDELIQAVKDIQEAYRALLLNLPPKGDPRLVAIARQRLEDEDEVGRLVKTFDKNASRVTGTQARAVNDFLKAYPRFLPNLYKCASGVRWGSPTAKKWGGGVFKDGVVHVAEMNSTPPDGFLRLVVHETGHATFQQVVCNRVKLPSALDTGQVAHLQARKLEIINLLNELPPGGRLKSTRIILSAQQLLALQQELADIDKKLLSVNNAWAKLPPDAQKLYRAWQVLRKDQGAHLLGIDLGPI